MKFKKLFTLTAIFLSATMLFGCAKKDEFNPSFKDKGQKIYLYGEFHGVKKIYDEELKIIEKHYNEGVRDMFIETSFATSEFLNIWMKEKDNKILDELFEDFKGTFVGTELNRNFYLTIKEKFPEIRFHGTDIEHKQTSYRYSMYLDENNIKDDFARKFVSDNREQKRIFNEDDNYRYREEKMVENFKRQYEKVGNKSIFGFYGSAHIDLSEKNDNRKKTDGYIMSEELQKLYGKNLILEDLSKIDMSIRKEKILENGKEYDAKYYDPIVNKVLGDIVRITEIWELENAYEDFKNFELNREQQFLGNYSYIVFQKNKIYKLKVQDKTINTEYEFFIRTDEEIKNGKIVAYPIKY